MENLATGIAVLLGSIFFYKILQDSYWEDYDKKKEEKEDKKSCFLA